MKEKVAVRVSDKIWRHRDVGFLAGRKIHINGANAVETKKGLAFKFLALHNGQVKEFQILSRHLSLPGSLPLTSSSP
mgnify:CR=1 FL=1